MPEFILRDSNGIMKAKISNRVFNTIMANDLEGEWVQGMLPPRFTIVEDYKLTLPGIEIFLWKGDFFVRED